MVLDWEPGLGVCLFQGKDGKKKYHSTDKKGIVVLRDRM